jgi:hypothetical protein
MTNEITIHPRKYDWRNRRQLDSPHGESIVYFSIKDETILENLVNRRNRPYTEWKKIAKRILSDNNINFEKLAWNKHAGCTMCPCSPGFIVKNGDIGNDIWIEVQA